MITPADVAAWQGASPVALNAAQAEQEMLLRRLIIEIGDDPLLGGTVVCSGGTTLHQVLLPAPRRYSEDLDLLLSADIPALKPLCDRWHDAIAPNLGASVKINTRGKFVKFRLTVPSQLQSVVVIKAELARSPHHIQAAATAQLQTVKMSSGWFSGSAPVACVDPVTLAASKVAAIRGRNKPRDLSDLLDMKTILGLSDTAVAQRFDDLFRIPQWTAGKARQVVSKFHATSKFQQTLHHEIANGFIPSGFSLQQAQKVYLGIVNEVEKILKARKVAAKIAEQATPRSCGRTVKSTGLPCLLPQHHRGNCRSILPSTKRS